MTDLQEYWNKSFKDIPEGKDPSAYAIEKERLFPRGAAVCDLGGSSGVDSLYFAKHAHSIILVDISDIALLQAKNAAEKLGVQSHLKTMQHDLGEGVVPLQDSTCDVMYSRLALHYFEPNVLRQLFKEIYRVLKPGGKAYVTLKSPDDKEEMRHLEKTAAQKQPGVFLEDGFVKTRFSMRQLDDILASTGIAAQEYAVTQYVESFRGRNDRVKSGKSELVLNEIIIHKNSGMVKV